MFIICVCRFCEALLYNCFICNLKCLYSLRFRTSSILNHGISFTMWSSDCFIHVYKTKSQYSSNVLNNLSCTVWCFFSECVSFIRLMPAAASLASHQKTVHNSAYVLLWKKPSSHTLYSGWWKFPEIETAYLTLCGFSFLAFYVSQTLWLPRPIIPRFSHFETFISLFSGFLSISFAHIYKIQSQNIQDRIFRNCWPPAYIRPGFKMFDDRESTVH